MRIQNNITAMNTHRQYTINNDNVAKAAEKLSSGYRINRAGDDAAGLAISEKMRSQIRGLNMATKNSQDAISLVQTAEGALQETHSMLQRMNELAVQAATGTNQEFDRTQAAKEFEQLKREINDVAESTTFNNMKILDGSLSYAGAQRSAQTAGATVTVTDIAGADKAGSVTGHVDGVAPSGSAAKLTATASTAIQTHVVDNGDSGRIQVTITDASGATNNITFSASGDGNKTMAQLFAGGVSQGGYTLTMGAGGAVTITADANGVKDIASFTAQANSTNGTTTALSNTPLTSPTVVSVGTAASAGTTGTDTMTIDMAKVGYGDKIEIGGTTYEIVKAAGDAKAGNTAVVWNGKTDNTSDLIAKLVAADAGTGGVVLAAGDPAGADPATKFTVSQATNGTGDTKPKYSMADGSDKRYTLEFDFAKLRDGDEISFKANGATVTAKKEAGQTRQDFMDSIKTAVEAAGGKVKGSAVIFDGKAITDVKLKRGDDPDDTNAMRIQVGALENEQLNIAIDSMNTAGLGLDEMNLETQDAAGKAITAVRNAVNQVSDQRATLGAMQNRLDHKIANLKVSSENLSAAESRIRDVDMASEMTNFTKNNILSQAATAMLAQANALPQNVLSLLG